jgi:hypothetical protein
MELCFFSKYEVKLLFGTRKGTELKRHAFLTLEQQYMGDKK